MLRQIACAMLIGGLVAPVNAQAPVPAPPQKVVPPDTTNGDPNERVCESITPVGSRLATRRFCGTRAEWADRKRQDREALDAAQRGPCVLTHNGGTGRPSC
jgi:hypothetical protein